MGDCRGFIFAARGFGGDSIVHRNYPYGTCKSLFCGPFCHRMDRVVDVRTLYNIM